MNTPDVKDTLVRLLREAFDAQPVPVGPHVVDDEDLLARWSMGELDAAEHEEIISHLADCPECREIVPLMVENGALVLPNASVPVPESPTARPPLAERRPTAVGQSLSAKIVKFGALAIAASLLVAVFLFWPRETRLGQSLALTEFDFELDGGSYGMSLRVLPDETRQQWDAKIAERPLEVRLRLEYGRLLLEHNHADDAITHFDEALKLEPNNADAHIGKGAALYEKAYNENSNNFEPALEQFRLALAQRPDDVSAQVNAAICLERLGRSGEAAKHFQEAYRLTDDSEMRDRIRTHLAERGIDI